MRLLMAISCAVLCGSLYAGDGEWKGKGHPNPEFRKCMQTQTGMTPEQEKAIHECHAANREAGGEEGHKGMHGLDNPQMTACLTGKKIDVKTLPNEDKMKAAFKSCHDQFKNKKQAAND